MTSRVFVSGCVAAGLLFAAPAVAQQVLPPMPVPVVPAPQIDQTRMQWEQARNGLMAAKQRTAQARAAWQRAEQSEAPFQAAFDRANANLLNILSVAAGRPITVPPTGPVLGNPTGGAPTPVGPTVNPTGGGTGTPVVSPTGPIPTGTPTGGTPVPPTGSTGTLAPAPLPAAGR